MGKVLRYHKPPNLSDKEITSTAVHLLMTMGFGKCSRTASSPDGFAGVFYDTFTEVMTPVLQKCSQKVKKERAADISFYRQKLQIPEAEGPYQKMAGHKYSHEIPC
jgi:hypothetical protein